MSVVVRQAVCHAPFVSEVAFKAVTVTVRIRLDHNDFPNITINKVSTSVVIGTNFEISRCACWAT